MHIAVPPIDRGTVERAHRAQDARAAAVYAHTPEPVYVDRDQAPTSKPGRLTAVDTVRIREAIAAARRDYPRPIADLIADHLHFHIDAGWAGDARGNVARLCDFLLAAPPLDAA